LRLQKKIENERLIDRKGRSQYLEMNKEEKEEKG
jgi:hypothetical protein